MNPEALVHWLRTRAAELGLGDCRIARAGLLEDDARRLEAWLHKGYQAGMGYMERHFDLRIDPRRLVPGAQSVVTFLINYFPEETQAPGVPRIARYAWGTDYHEVIRARLNQLLEELRAQAGAVEGRGFVDSAPVLERAWAVRSGQGWIGKNAHLLHPRKGSFFFLATLITDLALPADPPFRTDHCGTCTRCLDACPTAAIVAPGEVDANRCISYLTIELKDALMPTGMENRTDNWLFGCDVCQEVCPWNRFSQPHQEPAFHPLPEVLSLPAQEWAAMTEESFREVFRHTPLKRTKWKGIQRNLRAIRKE